jgi:ribosomal protein S5
LGEALTNPPREKNKMVRNIHRRDASSGEKQSGGKILLHLDLRGVSVSRGGITHQVYRCAGVCEYSNELSGYTKSGEFLD